MTLQNILNVPHRLSATLVLLCYLFVSVALPFQHTDCLISQVEPVPQSMSVTPSHSSNAAPKREVKAASIVRHTHCNACEWQALQVSPALPAFAFHFTPPPATRAITTFPRYLSLPAFAPSSRGPPTV